VCDGAAGDANQKIACEDGALMLKMYSGSDTGCTGTAQTMNYQQAAIQGGSNCFPMDALDFGMALYYSMGCVGDTPKMIMHNTSDCSDSCVYAMNMAQFGVNTECTPSVRARSRVPLPSHNHH
jgi:hypothetical protein